MIDTVVAFVEPHKSGCSRIALWICDWQDVPFCDVWECDYGGLDLSTGNFVRVKFENCHGKTILS